MPYIWPHSFRKLDCFNERWRLANLFFVPLSLYFLYIIPHFIWIRLFTTMVSSNNRTSHLTQLCHSCKQIFAFYSLFFVTLWNWDLPKCSQVTVSSKENQALCVHVIYRHRISKLKVIVRFPAANNIPPLKLSDFKGGHWLVLKLFCLHPTITLP